MKEYIPTLAALAALFLLLAAMLALVHCGQKITDVIGLGFAGALTTLISGFVPSFSSKGSSQVTNAPNATSVSNEQTGAGQHPAAEIPNAQLGKKE